MATFREFMRIADLTIRDKTSSKRMKEIFEILKRHDVQHGISPEKTVSILEELGPTYVKMGQIASNRSDLLPQKYCEALEKLRANVPPLPFDTVVGIIERAYGTPWDQVFSTIEQTPLGSASIAQVHKAVLRDGTVVAVKVRRPGIVEQMAEDIMLMKHLLALAAFSTPSNDSMLLTLDGFVAELERTTSNELDFNVELANLVRFYNDTEAQEGISSPLPYPHYSTDNVLVMQFVTGSAILGDEADDRTQRDQEELGTRLAQSYVTQVIDNGFFHADPHPGNILLDDDTIVWIDLGMTGSLSGSERALVSRAFQGIATQNVFELKEALLGLTKETGKVDHGALMGKISTLLAQYGSTDLAELNVGTAFLDIIEVLRAQNLAVSPSFTMLARGFLTLEGVLAGLSPSTNLVDIIAKHVEKQLGNPSSLMHRAKTLAANTAESTEAATRIPTQLSNTLTMLNRGQIKVNSDVNVPASFVSSLSSIIGTASLALISTGLFIGSSVLCTTNMQPRIFEVPVLGILGYLGAFVLGVYVTVRTLSARSKQ